MKTILVVEDNNVIRNEITDVFEMENFEVLEAGNGLDGFIKAVNNLPDIIVSDIMMPVLDGYKMFKELKMNPMTEQIPIIFLSALSTDDNVRKGMNLGAEDYLTKPVKPDDLILAAESKLEKYSKIKKRYDEVKTNITNILYHELNTPLNGIIGFSDYLRNQADDLSKENIKKVANNIFVSGNRLNKLVHKYLNYSELKMQATNISDIKKLKNCEYTDTKKVLNTILISEKYKNRKNDFEINLESAELKMEESLFKLMTEELIENAVKFSSSGNKIFVNSYIENDSLIFKIKNQGSGLTKEQIMNITDFKQLNTKTYAQSGSGIGLSIVKLIIDIYGGDFKIESVSKTFFAVILSFNKFIKK